MEIDGLMRLAKCRELMAERGEHLLSGDLRD